MANDFRICDMTGLKVFKSTETLIKTNAVTSIVFLAIGGLFGLLVALTRWPEIHLLPADWFYLALTAHGLDVLLVWIIFFEVAVLYFASSVLLGSRLACPKIAWAAFAMMLGGAVTTNLAVLFGNSSVMFTSYVPMRADPEFYLGLILFAVGLLLAVISFFGTLVIAKRDKTYRGSVPLVTFGAITAAIIAVFTVASGAVILIPTWLWSMDLISDIDPIIYKIIWWAMGHASQQVNVAIMVAIWYAIAAMVLGAKPLSEKVSRTAFLLYIVFLQLASVHHLLVEPGLSSEYKIFNTSYAMYLAVLGSMIHGMTVPGAIEVAQRKRGLNKGLFEWLRKAPWSNPAFAGMFMSLVLFGFLGGITGVVMGTEQINLIIHNTLYVPGHFHGTVVAGTTLAFMAMTYLLVPLIFKKQIVMQGLAKWQPYLFAVGVSGISLFMMGAGTLGVPRRHWDMTFSDALMSADLPPTAFLMMGLNGASAVLASIGGISFILIILGSVLFGKPVTKKNMWPKLASGENKSPKAKVVSEYGTAGTWEVPGTVVLVAIFFLTFVLYYFVNWKYLAEVWPLS